MKIIKPSVTIMDDIDEEQILKKIELCGRTAYKTEDKITKDSAVRFVSSLVKAKHFSVIEHINLTVKFICDRGVTHEIVRHRLASYTQESTRYCNYASNKKDMTFIEPPWGFNQEDLVFLDNVEKHYNKKIKEGMTPEKARFFLPNGLKTELVMTANLREWCYILDLRTQPDCHPQMQEIMNMLLEKMKKAIPCLF